MKKIVNYGLVRGVRIIPELPTPSHSSSWIKSKEHSEMKACPTLRAHRPGLDVFSDKSLTLMKEVFAEVFELFPDPVVHLGGEPLDTRCIDLVKSKLTSAEMKKLGSSNSDKGYIEVGNIEYRKEQRKILK